MLSTKSLLRASRDASLGLIRSMKASRKSWITVAEKAGLTERGLLHALDHALEKSGSEEAGRQVQIAGWSEEVRGTLLDALDAYYLAQKRLIEQTL